MNPEKPQVRSLYKPKLSIEILGTRQFYTGVIMGVFSAIVIGFFINYSREACRLITFLGDPLIVSDKESRWYDLFFAMLAASLGFGFTIIYWLVGRNRKIRKRYLQVFTISNSVLVNAIVLLLVSRIGAVFSIILYGQKGYDGHLDFLTEFWPIMVFLPLYIFLEHWRSIRMIFRVGKWIFYSIILYFIVVLGLFVFAPADSDILNNSYYEHNSWKFEYIDNELEKAEELGIDFSGTIKEILRYEHAERTQKLVSDLRLSFEMNTSVPLDTLILEKIVIHNMNRHSYSHFVHGRDCDENWSYVLPEVLYRHILNSDPGSEEARLLFEILAEQINLFNLPREQHSDWYEYSVYEKIKIWKRGRLIWSHASLPERLKLIVEILQDDDRFNYYTSQLPEMRFDEKEVRQVVYFIEDGDTAEIEEIVIIGN